LEEPPDKTLFLVVSEQPDLLLPTIISRVQKIAVTGIEHSDIVHYLHEQFTVEKEKAVWIANFCEGNFHQALELIEISEEDLYFLKHFQEWMRMSFARRMHSQMPEWVDKTAAMGRETIKEFLTYSLKALRKNLIRNLQVQPLLKELPEESDFNIKFSRFVHVGNTAEMSSLINKAIADIERNGNLKMILLDTSLQLHKLLNLQG
jgi:DNA polymerase-3 subunit delta'